VGIALARALKASHYSPIDQFLWTALFGVTLAAFSIINRRYRGFRPIRSSILILLVPFSIFLLASIGLAAGIH